MDLLHDFLKPDERREADLERLAVKRLQSELSRLADLQPYCHASPVRDDLFHWRATILGPENGPYEGGVFVMEITFPRHYPFQPPQMRFVTPIFHPNVESGSGEICMNRLQTDWSPSRTMAQVFLFICSLLNDPSSENPSEVEISFIYKEKREQFNQIAREWTRKYASMEFVNE